MSLQSRKPRAQCSLQREERWHTCAVDPELFPDVLVCGEGMPRMPSLPHREGRRSLPSASLISRINRFTRMRLVLCTPSSEAPRSTREKQPESDRRVHARCPAALPRHARGCLRRHGRLAAAGGTQGCGDRAAGAPPLRAAARCLADGMAAWCGAGLRCVSPCARGAYTSDTKNSRAHAPPLPCPCPGG